MALPNRPHQYEFSTLTIVYLFWLSATSPWRNPTKALFPIAPEPSRFCVLTEGLLMEVNNSSQPWNTSAVYDSRSRCVHLPYPMRYLPFTFTEPLIGSALFLAAHCRSSKLHSAPVHVSLNSSETLIGDRCRDWLMRFPYNMYMQHTLQSLFEGLSKGMC